LIGKDFNRDKQDIESFSESAEDKSKVTLTAVSRLQTLLSDFLLYQPSDIT
jgi:hypothetical protein